MAWNYAEKGVVFGLVVGVIMMVLLMKYDALNYAIFCFNTSGEDKSCLSYNTIFPLLTAIIGMVIGKIADEIIKRREEEYS